MSGVTIDRKESPPQRLYQLLWRHAALGLWFLRAFVRVVRHSGPDVA